MHGGTFKVLKKLRDKRVTLMNRNSDIYGVFQEKPISIYFLLRTDDPINGWKG